MENIRSIVDFDGFYNNSAYSITFKYVKYGEITDPNLRPFSCAFDVVAHEWAHGINRHAANLDPPDDHDDLAGALKESFSDMIAAYATFKKISTDPDKVWVWGEDVSDIHTVQRSMREPEVYVHPSVYLGPNWYTDSNHEFFTHINCGVPNKMFHLLSIGGENDHNLGIVVTGLGIDLAAKIVLRANTERYWTEHSDFFDGRDGMFRSALWHEDQDETRLRGDFTVPVCQAWNAVGVTETLCGTYTPGDLDGDGLVGRVSDYLGFS